MSTGPPASSASSSSEAASSSSSSSASPEKTKKFKYLCFLGNNSDLIRVCLQRRSGWWTTALDDEDSTGKISTNLGVSLFGGPPRRDYNGHKLLGEKALLANAFDFCWRPTLGLKLSTGATITIHSVEPKASSATQQQALQLCNHFPSVKCIASKTGLLRSLLRYYSRCGVEPFANVPTTFILKDVGRTGSSDFSAFCAHFRHLEKGDLAAAGEKMPPKHCKKNMWLVKPSYANQGRGIKVFSTLQEIKDFLVEHTSATGASSTSSGSRDAEYIVQKYIERPLLTGGRKFDCRIWVVATDNFDIYVYNDGYCRTSSEFYSLGGGETMVHLTNYCMQKHSSKLGAFEEGNTLSLEQLQTYLDAAYGPGIISVRKDLFPRWREYILDSLLANRDRLIQGNKGRRYFELFGYDFMVDEDFRSWLIEVNTDPYIDKQNPWHHRLLCRMAEDLTRLCIDPLFPPQGSQMAAAAAATGVAPTSGTVPPPQTPRPRIPTMLPYNTPQATVQQVLSNCKDGSVTAAVLPNTSAPITAVPGYLPLPNAAYTHAFSYALPWETKRIKGIKPKKGLGGAGAGAGAGAAGEEDKASGGAAGAGEGAGAAPAEGAAPLEHPADAIKAAGEANKLSKLQSELLALANAAPSHPSGRPLGNASWSWEDTKTSPPELAPTGAPQPLQQFFPPASSSSPFVRCGHYRDPTVNGWELIFSENPAVPVLAIPHQAAMAVASSNAAAVEMCTTKFGGDCAKMTAADVKAAGVPLKMPERIPGICDETSPTKMSSSTVGALAANGTSAKPGAKVSAAAAAAAVGVDADNEEEADSEAAPVAGSMDVPAHMSPFARRYIHVRDRDWLMPLGGSCEEVLGLTEAALAQHRSQPPIVNGGGSGAGEKLKADSPYAAKVGPGGGGGGGGGGKDSASSRSTGGGSVPSSPSNRSNGGTRGPSSSPLRSPRGQPGPPSSNGGSDEDGGSGLAIGGAAPSGRSGGGGGGGGGGSSTGVASAGLRRRAAPGASGNTASRPQPAPRQVASTAVVELSTALSGGVTGVNPNAPPQPPQPLGKTGPGTLLTGSIAGLLGLPGVGSPGGLPPLGLPLGIGIEPVASSSSGNTPGTSPPRGTDYLLAAAAANGTSISSTLAALDPASVAFLANAPVPGHRGRMLPHPDATSPLISAPRSAGVYGRMRASSSGPVAVAGLVRGARNIARGLPASSSRGPPFAQHHQVAAASSGLAPRILGGGGASSGGLLLPSTTTATPGSLILGSQYQLPAVPASAGAVRGAFLPAVPAALPPAQSAILLASPRRTNNLAATKAMGLILADSSVPASSPALDVDPTLMPPLSSAVLSGLLSPPATGTGFLSPSSAPASPAAGRGVLMGTGGLPTAAGFGGPKLKTPAALLMGALGGPGATLYR